MVLVWATYLGLPIVTLAVTVVLAYWVYTRHGDVRGAPWFLLTLGLGGVWMVLHLAHLLATDGDIQVILFLLATKVAIASFLAWALFASRYSRQDFHRHPLARIGLGLIAADLLLPTFWGPIRELWYEPPVRHAEPFAYVAVEPRLPGVVVALTISVFVLYAVFALVRYMLATPEHSGTQLVLLVLASVPVPIMVVLGQADLFPASELNHATYGVLFFDLFATLALFRFRLFDVQPVARNAVVEQLSDPVFILDGDRRLVDYNEATQRLVPDVDEQVGQPLSGVDPSLSGAVARVRGESSSDAESTELTLPVDGQQRHYSVNVSAIGGDGENPEWYSVVLRDLTAMERSRAQLATQNERLDQVASTISHDLRNPINVAQGFLDVIEERLEEADLDPAVRSEIHEYVEKVDGSHDRMLDIIEDILTIAREGKTVEETERVGLAAVAESAWDNVETTAATLQVRQDADFQADRSKLLTVFENLFRNAVEHAGEDVAVEVGATAEGFYVQDDGPGIDPDNRETVFEYGYSTGSEGTGLGLSIVETMAESHGWTVALDTDYDDGARFEFRLGGELPEPRDEPVAAAILR